jgi:hypothetical protein
MPSNFVAKTLHREGDFWVFLQKQYKKFPTRVVKYLIFSGESFLGNSFLDIFFVQF